MSSTPILPTGLQITSNFLSDDEASRTLEIIHREGNEWAIEGYEARRRVQRYQYDDDNDNDGSNHSIEEEAVLLSQHNTNDDDTYDTGNDDADHNATRRQLQMIANRILSRLNNDDDVHSAASATSCCCSTSSTAAADPPNGTTSTTTTPIIKTTTTTHPKKYKYERANEIIVEERYAANYTACAAASAESQVGFTVTTFEPSNPTVRCACYDDDHHTPTNDNTTQPPDYRRCRCYVAQLTLQNPCLQSLNKPSSRDVECWDLVSPNHYTDILMEPNSLLVKRGECLWEWRNRIGTPTKWKGLRMADGDDDDGRKGVVEQRVLKEGSRIVTIKFRCVRSRVVVDNGLNDANKKVVSMRVVEGVDNDERGDTTIHNNNELGDGMERLSIQKRKQNDTQSASTSPPSLPPIIITAKPLSQLLTIIVTTSPIKSNPSTEVMEKTFETFHLAGREFAYDCPKVIICDGCRVIEKREHNHLHQYPKNNRKKRSGGNADSESAGASAGAGVAGTDAERPPPKVTRKHANVKQALRNGIATNDQMDKYRQFKSFLHTLCANANNYNNNNNNTSNESETTTTANTNSKTNQKKPSPFRNTKVVELEERHGYGFALRHALLHEVSTPYVCVIQHDRTFMRTTPIKEVVDSMRHEGKVKYVGMNMRSNLIYRDIFSSRYGKAASLELQSMVLHPPQLALDADTYGPEGSSVKNMTFSNETVRKSVASLGQSYKKTLQYLSHIEMMAAADTTTTATTTTTTDDDTTCVESKTMTRGGKHQLSLTPTIFWFDNTHICETEHYRDFIFHPKYRMVARGGFVEDKLSPVITKNVERIGLTEGHKKFGCYVLDDHSGFFFTGHLDGGSYMTKDEQVKFSRENGYIS